jgi:O-antigen ligase
MEFLSTLGPWMYPLGGVAVLLLVDITRAGAAIARIDGEFPASGPPHHTVLGWGVLAGVVGLLGTVVGFGRVAVGARAATGAERAELEGMLELMWEGVMVIVTPTIAGLGLFTAALVAWLILQYAFTARMR